MNTSSSKDFKTTTVLSLAQCYKGMSQQATCSETAGLVRDLNPGPLAPKARIIPLDQRAMLKAIFSGGCHKFSEVHLAV